MDLNEQKQQFSVALVRAVAAVSGLAYARSDTDDDSIDATIALRGGNGTIRSPKLDLQLKCTSSTGSGGTELSFALPVKNYDELRHTDVMVPRILVVVFVPDQVDQWLACSEDSFAMRRCAYWLSIRGSPESANTASVTVKLSGTQVFDPPALAAIFAKLKEGRLP